MAGLDKPSHPFKLNRESENLILLSRDLATRSECWSSRPTEVEFSLNNFCNLKCIMCGKADGEANISMDKTLGTRILDEVLPCALHLTPSANSEPLLNDLDLVMELCDRHDVTLFLFTNGQLCTEERFLKIRRRVHRLWFSIDSHVKETFEKIRAGADYETVFGNVKRTLALAAEDNTEITFHFVLMQLNLHQLPDYVRFIAGLGGKQIQVQELLPNSRRYDELRVIGQLPEKEVIQVLEDARTAAREAGIDLLFTLPAPYSGDVKIHPEGLCTKAPIQALRELHMQSFTRVYPNFCSMSMNYVKIDPKGDLYPCCRAPESLRMGNLGDRSFDAIWNGEAYRTFRRKMFERNYENVCRGCSVLTNNPDFSPLPG